MAKKSKEYTFSRFIKDMDLFGYPVQLNFDEKGPTHQTCCGGISTFIFLILVIILVLGQFISMASSAQSMYFTHELPYDASASADSLSDASTGLNTFVYFVNTNSDSNPPPPVVTTTVSTLLSVSYKDSGGASVQAVSCGEEFFSDTQKATGESDQTIYEQLSPFYGAMFCPANSETNPLDLTLEIKCEGTCSSSLDDWTAVTMMNANKLNMASSDTPLFSYLFTTGTFPLSSSVRYWHSVPLRFNQMVLPDSSQTFIDNQYADSGAIITGKNQGIQQSTVLQQSFQISPLALKHHMRVYTFQIWLAIVGGLIYSLFLAFTWCVRPCAKHGFLLRAIKRMYMVRTKDESLFKVRSNDSVRYKRDFPEIHDDVPNWPILTDPVCEDCCESVLDQNFAPNQNSIQYVDDQYEGGNRASPRFVNDGGNSRGSSRGRNPRSKKTYYEDTPYGNEQTYSQTAKSRQPQQQQQKLSKKQQQLKNQRQESNDRKKNTKKGAPAPKKPMGRKVNQLENPVLQKCSQMVQEEIATHRVFRIYNTKWIGMCWCNAARKIICCSAKTCDCCCNGCFSNIKHFEVYDKGEQRLMEEMDIVKILKKMRHMHTMMNSTHVHSEKRRFKLSHTFENIIDIVESDDDCCQYKKQDRKMKIAALDGETLPSDAEEPQMSKRNANQAQQPFTPTMGGEPQDENDEPPTFEQEVDRNIDHQIVNNGYPVGVPCCPKLPPPPPVQVYYAREPMPQEQKLMPPPKQHKHQYVENSASFEPVEQRRNDQQERFERKYSAQKHTSNVRIAQPRQRGSAGEQSYASEEEYDSQLSSERQDYYNQRNGSQVRQEHTPQGKKSDHAPIHDFREEQPNLRKPDPQEDLYTEQRKMTLPRYKQGKKFDKTQKNPNAVLNKYNRFEVEER